MPSNGLRALGVALGVALALPATALAAHDVRVAGTFRMSARVTTAVNVAGEHAGDRYVRQWTVTPENCTGNRCERLALVREHSNHTFDHVTLRRRAPGVFAGSAAFYAPLRCEGRVYPRGSRVPFSVTLTATAGQSVDGLRFARSIRATYLNRHRTNRTPCFFRPGHDAGSYRSEGRPVLPPGPAASFTETVDPLTNFASFTDTSVPGPNGGQIVTRSWNFGDPSSGAANTSTLSAPTHQYAKPGVYRVTLTVRESLGLTGHTTRAVAVVAPPG